MHPEGTGWTETGVTWSNQPSWNNGVLSTSGTVTANTSLVITLPVTSIAISGETDFALTYSPSGIAETLASREDASHPPQLTVVLAGVTPSPSATPTPSPSSSPSPTPTPTASPTPTSTATASPSPTPGGNPYCGTATGTPATSKLLVIFEENKGFSAILPDTGFTPNIQSYANACGLLTNYFALTHMSLSNYMEATSGLSYGFSPWADNCSPSSTCSTANDNIFNQVGPSGWKSYQESMPSNCYLGSSGAYTPRHNPALYYTNIDGGSLGGGSCAVNDVPLGSTTGGRLLDDVNAGTLPAYSLVTPNLQNDMHDGTVAQGDAWLATWIPLITGGQDYQAGRLTVVITWDEGGGSGDTPSQVATILMSPYIVPGTTSGMYFNHYTLFNLAQQIAGKGLRTVFGF